MENKYKATENEWNELFELAKKIYDLKMWDVLYDTDLIKLYNINPNSFAIASILGKNKEVYGINLAFGFAGMCGLNLMENADASLLSDLEITMKQDLVVLYFDNLDIDIYYMDDLKENYHYIFYDNKIVYFKRLQPEFYPRELEKSDVEKTIKYFKLLIGAYNYYINNNLKILHDDELIYVYYLNKNGEEKTRFEKYNSLDICALYEVENSDIKAYKKYSKNDDVLEMSFKYLNISYKGYHQYYSPGKTLFFVNNSTGEILFADAINYYEKEGQIALDVICSYIELNRKRPKKIIIDNILMFSYLMEFLEKINVEIEVKEKLERISNIVDDINKDIDDPTIEGVQ